MKKRFLAILLCALMLTSFGATLVSAESNDTVVEAQSFLGGILAFNGVSGDGKAIQSWIDGELSQNAGHGSEWYVLALAQHGAYDFSAYESALLSYLKDEPVHSASSRLKYALCLSAIGSTDKYILSTLNDSVGEQGLMSWVFGMHLLNNGYVSSKYTLSDVKNKLLELQCEDGGWAIMGKNGDIDATAMTVQALAPYYTSDQTVKLALDRATALLSAKQLDGGDYLSYGSPNTESTAQVLTALSALGIDPETDARFIKNGSTVLDGMERYLLSDGSFCHVEGGGYNETATVQAFYAFVSYIRMLNGKGSLYILDGARPSEAEKSEDISEPGGPSEPSQGITDQTKTDNGGFGYKPWACLAIICVGACVCVLLIVLKKKNFKNFIAVLIVCAVGVTVVLVTDIQTADGYYGGTADPKENVIGSVTLTIRCDTVAGEAEHIPKNGIILDTAVFDIAEGDTVYTVLTDAARKYKIQIENNGNASYVYISGINYLYEFDYGDLSGWVYRVNGSRPSVGAGEYRLSDGDVIEWHYTRDLGNDIR